MYYKGMENQENEKISSIEELVALIQRTVVHDIAVIKFDVTEIKQGVKDIKEWTIADHKHQIEKLEGDVKELRKALAM